jgi:2-amino-4-hydroxy-6-hydroxymethyldihydropteridine diphosphokinase
VGSEPSVPKKVYLSLGSNVGNREENLRQAIALLAEAGVTVARVSSVYETEPVDYREQEWFLNCVVEGETDVKAEELLRRLRETETGMGSRRVIAKGPRLMDMDILLYGDETIQTPELEVPHPRMLQRRFVMEPLAEIAPALMHPTWRRTAAEILSELTDRNEVRKLGAP